MLRYKVAGKLGSHECVELGQTWTFTPPSGLLDLCLLRAFMHYAAVWFSPG